MMPDAAFQVTEMQFMRLVGSSNQIAQFFIYPFTVPGLPRSPETKSTSIPTTPPLKNSRKMAWTP
jgi:homoserine O-succinyltransferase